MTTGKLRTIENLILLTFTAVVFAGCAGGDVKPVTAEKQSVPNIFTSQETESADTQSEMDTSPKSFALTSDDTLNIERIEIKEHELTDQPVIEEVSVAQETESLKEPENKLFFFDTNAHLLSDEQKNELKLHADYLIENPGTVLVINGHADERGTETYNQSLSEKRAMETFQFLVNLGVAENQLETIGLGELVPMHTENNWDENRRVELKYSDPVMMSSM